jgi:excisionase family DNA binding protein
MFSTVTDTTVLLTPTEAAKILRVDPKTVVRWIKAGTMPGIITPGNRYRVRRSDLDALIATNTDDAA